MLALDLSRPRISKKTFAPRRFPQSPFLTCKFAAISPSSFAKISRSAERRKLSWTSQLNKRTSRPPALGSARNESGGADGLFWLGLVPALFRRRGAEALRGQQGLPCLSLQADWFQGYGHRPLHRQRNFCCQRSATWPKRG